MVTDTTPTLGETFPISSKVWLLNYDRKFDIIADVEILTNCICSDNRLQLAHEFNFVIHVQRII